MTGELNGASGGGVIWICGLSGVGKTTLAFEVVRLMTEVHPSVVRIDGDDFRRTFMPSAGYEREARINVAHAIARHAWELAQRGSLCVVATISLFAEIHDDNRSNERTYQLPFIQSLLSAPATLLRERHTSLMRDAANIVGMDIKAELPNTPDHTFINAGSIESLLSEAIAIRDLWLALRHLTGCRAA